jgi:NAD(P)-dependent dehydrogenase (short-subunit alcohol dehydrogenase family)
MQIDLSGKHAIVTGSTAGIGLTIATELARSGASLTIIGRTQEKVDAAIIKIAQESGNEKITSVTADLATAEGCQTLIEAIPETDILINNLGNQRLSPVF